MKQGINLIVKLLSKRQEFMSGASLQRGPIDRVVQRLWNEINIGEGCWLKDCQVSRYIL